MHGAVAPDATWGSALALVPAVVGMKLGAALRMRVSAAAFRKLFFLLLVTLGTHRIWHGLW